jgi:hypothetical protein
MQTLGQQFDRECSFEEKACYHAIRDTKLYLDVHLDATAREMVQTWSHRHCVSRLYSEFFKRFALVFSRPDTLYIEWTCRNPNACIISLMRELSN